MTLPELLSERIRACATVDELAAELTSFMLDCRIVEVNGAPKIALERALLLRAVKFQIEIKNHGQTPPNFHIVGPGIDAGFKLADCDKVEGQISDCDLRKIRAWHSELNGGGKLLEFCGTSIDPS